MSKQVGIVFPSNNPEHAFDIFAPSVKHIKDCGIHWKLLGVFQPPWTEKLIREFTNLIQMDYHWQSEIAKRCPSMCHLRNQAIQFDTHLDYYMFQDDNTMFSSGTTKYPRSSGERFNEVIQYLEDNPKCGVVMCEGSLGGAQRGYEIQPYPGGLIATTRGLFFRNTGKIYPSGMWKLAGGMEESIAAFYAIEKGYYIAKQFNNPTRCMHRHKPNESAPGSIHDPDVTDANVVAYIRERWNDPTWTHESRRLPRGLQNG